MDPQNLSKIDEIGDMKVGSTHGTTESRRRRALTLSRASPEPLAPTIGVSPGVRCCTAWATARPNRAPWELPNPYKIEEKNDAKIDAEKIYGKNMKKRRKVPRIDAEFNKKSIRFRNPRFLNFGEGYNVKIVFSHDPWYRNDIHIL